MNQIHESHGSRDTSARPLSKQETELALERLEESVAASAPSSKLSQGTPSAPLFGVLPLARVIPQDVHSVMDYLDAAAVASGALMTKCPRATAASLLVGGSGVVASAMTDYKLSLAQLIPIETHEAIDYGFGVASITLPFALGYYKTAPVVAALHVMTGVGTILASLFTDYRAYRGVGRRRALPAA